MKYKDRIRFVRECLRDNYKYQPDLHPFRIVVKDLVSPDVALESLYSQNCGFPVDGWILINVDRPYCCGKDTCLFKYKQEGLIPAMFPVHL